MNARTENQSSRRSRLGRHARWLFAAGVLSVLAARPALALYDPGDADEDGVADVVDSCLDTPIGDVIGADGCSPCPCDASIDGAAWASHKAYVACVAGAAKALGMPPKDIRSAVRSAKASTCGIPGLTRCCIYRDWDDETGRCRIMTPLACEALDERLLDTDGEADDEDGGSCLPNPCAF